MIKFSLHLFLSVDTEKYMYVLKLKFDGTVVSQLLAVKVGDRSLRLFKLLLGNIRDILQIYFKYDIWSDLFENFSYITLETITKKSNVYFVC